MKDYIYRALKALRAVPVWQVVGRGLAAMIVVLLLLQLFSFERIPGLLTQQGLSNPWSIVLAIGLVLSELLALPFLLGMRTSSMVLRSSEVASVVAVSLLVVVGIAGLHKGGVVCGAYTQNIPVAVQLLVIISCAVSYGYYKYKHNKANKKAL